MDIKEMFLTPNKYSRPQKEMGDLKGVVIHYVANKNTSAEANRNFFELRKNGNYGYGSTHYIIGLKGEIIQCLPENEISYNCGARKYIEGIQDKLGKNPNYHTIGIECTHFDDFGRMTNSTYISLIELTQNLLKRYSLTSQDLYRHYDITGKICHKWFVDNPNEWDIFKKTFQEV
jgi:N-acetylmuramoyl-L-alanine amidase